GVTIVINDGDVARADILQGGVATVNALSRIGRGARSSLADRAVRLDKSTALGGITAVEPAADRGGDENRVRRITGAGGGDETLCLYDAVHRFHGERLIAEIERLDERKHLTQGHCARRGGSCAADFVSPIQKAHRIAQLGAVLREILCRERARTARIVLRG